MDIPEKCPPELDALDLKVRLTWLYAKTFHVPPVVMSSAPDRVIGFMRMQAAEMETSKEIDDYVFARAFDALRRYPNCMRGMFEWGGMGMGYTIFRTPVCFFLPEIIFLMNGSRPPLAWLDSMSARLATCLEPYWEKDEE